VSETTANLDSESGNAPPMVAETDAELDQDRIEEELEMPAEAVGQENQE
jgi:hypothetical protein